MAVIGLEPLSPVKPNGRQDVEVTAISSFTGKERSRVMEMTAADWRAWSKECVLIQQAFPYLSADDREFLMTGCTPEEWEELFGKED